MLVMPYCGIGMLNTPKFSRSINTLSFRSNDVHTTQTVAQCATWTYESCPRLCHVYNNTSVLYMSHLYSKTHPHLNNKRTPNIKIAFLAFKISVTLNLYMMGAFFFKGDVQLYGFTKTGLHLNIAIINYFHTLHLGFWKFIWGKVYLYNEMLI